MKSLSMLKLLAAVMIFASSLATAGVACAQGKTENAILVEQGRYMVEMAGCNDCHTAGFLASSSKIPEKDRLMGGDLGWRGPWGTTYAPNLRLTLSKISEKEWIKMAKKLVRRPTMPYWVLNKMKESDLKSIYAYIRQLGPVGSPGKDYLPAGQIPAPPYADMIFPPPPPSSK